MTVLESLNLSTEYLLKKGIESPRLNAEILLSEILNCKRLDLYLRFDRPLAADEIDSYRDFIARRGRHEPLQYIVGYVIFSGLKIEVNNSVLIPRPETEILVQKIVDDYDPKTKIKILDIGTGSGNIAISLSLNFPESEITAIDASEVALNMAKRNAELNNVSNRINFLRKDILSSSFEKEQFDVVVSNPPYVSENDYKTLQREIINYEPMIAVTDSKDGLSFYKKISNCAADILKWGGKLYFEIGDGLADQVLNILRENNFKEINMLHDLQNIPRVAIGVK